MTDFKTTCNICHKPLTVKADEAGLPIAMQLGLSKGLSHDICSDRALRRRDAAGVIEQCCHKLAFLRKQMSSEEVLLIQKMLAAAAERYGTVDAEELDVREPIQMAEALVTPLMMRPKEVTGIMSGYTAAVRQLKFNIQAAINFDTRKLL